MRKNPRMDWVAWHAEYDEADSPLTRRLAIVQEQIRVVLDRAAAGPISVLSLCAGQGRDLLEVVAAHPRGGDVRGRLVEIDPELAAVARRAAPASIEVVEADAGLTDAYAGMVPADLVLACGVFGNIEPADVERTVDYCGQLCAEGGTVVWTRHRREPDLVPAVGEWFVRSGFEPVMLTPPELRFCVGAHRRVRPPEPLRTGERMFAFTGGRV